MYILYYNMFTVSICIHFFFVPGTPALTSRGFKEKDFEQVGDFMDEAIDLGIAINKTAEGILFICVEKYYVYITQYDYC